MHRKYAALTTTTILVYTLLAVNLFTPRAQKPSVLPCDQKTLETTFRKMRSEVSVARSGGDFCKIALKSREIS
jgi:hypothetical protein